MTSTAESERLAMWALVCDMPDHKQRDKIMQRFFELANRLSAADARAEECFKDKLGEKAIRMIAEADLVAAQAKIDAAQSILDRIDSTADGVKVLPGDRIWHPLDDGVTSVDWNENDGYYGIRRSPDECCEHCKRGTFWKRHKVSEFYSTQGLAQRARAAIEAGKVGR